MQLIFALDEKHHKILIKNHQIIRGCLGLSQELFPAYPSTVLLICLFFMNILIFVLLKNAKLTSGSDGLGTLVRSSLYLMFSFDLY